MKKRSIGPAPNQVIALGFLGIIVTGALLLMLPFANRDGQGLSFLDSLFTATSATCVTGLVVADTWSQFNLLGQIWAQPEACGTLFSTACPPSATRAST